MLITVSSQETFWLPSVCMYVYEFDSVKPVNGWWISIYTLHNTCFDLLIMFSGTFNPKPAWPHTLLVITTILPPIWCYYSTLFLQRIPTLLPEFAEQLSLHLNILKEWWNEEVDTFCEEPSGRPHTTSVWGRVYAWSQWNPPSTDSSKESQWCRATDHNQTPASDSLILYDVTKFYQRQLGLMDNVTVVYAQQTFLPSHWHLPLLHLQYMPTNVCKLLLCAYFIIIDYFQSDKNILYP